MVSSRGDVNCLFLSHLDSDHVKGIDRLLLSSQVNEVVLPYLNDLDRLIAAAHDEARGTLSGDFLTFLSDPTAWFGARGVARVTHIIPSDDDDEDGGGGPEVPRFDGGGEGPIKAKWLHSRSGDAQFSGDRQGRGKGPVVRKFELGSMLCLSAANGMLDWLLLPYAHRPSDSRLKAFQKAMFRQFGPKYRFRLKAMINDAEMRKKIRACYDLIWSDHNLVSLALYAGPSDSSAWSSECRSPPGWWRGTGGVVGWLETGDMHLDVGRRRNAMLRHYQYVLNQVNVFALPHHGSHRNFHQSLPAMLPNLTQCVAAAGPNGYGHPNLEVRELVQSAGIEFVHVTDRGQSALQWRHGI